MTISNDVTLRVDNKIFGGWMTVAVDRSLRAIAGGFQLSITERWPGCQDLHQILPGMACEVRIGDDTVITGWINDVEPAYDATSHQVTITGRDATGDLVDCSATAGTGMWNAPSLMRIVTDVCAPFGIPVKSDLPDVQRIIYAAQLQPGETAFECIERHCRMWAVLPTSDGLGDLVLTRAGEGGAVAGLKLGDNIKAGRAKLSDRDRYSRYIVLGQTAAGGTDFSLFTGPRGEARDAGVKRYRPLEVMAEAEYFDPEWFRRRAEWERAARAGRSRVFTATVTGWRDKDGALFRPNAMVRLDDDFLGAHGTYVIADVRLSLSDQGRLSELTLTDKEAFALETPRNLTFDPGALS